jgi:hypothetical protein
MASETDAPETVSTTPTDAAMATAHAQLRELLVPGEELQATSQQRRIFALTHRRTIVAATTNRFIGMTRGLIGGYTPLDVRWQDVHDVDLRVGILGATLTIHANAPADLAMAGHISGTQIYHGLAKSSAQAVYRICQAQEQAWREKRRVRELEELRAKSGGIQMGASPMGGTVPEARAGDAVQRLAQAKEMLDKGLINDSEYESMKARIIGAM